MARGSEYDRRNEGLMTLKTGLVFQWRSAYSQLQNFVEGCRVFSGRRPLGFSEEDGHRHGMTTINCWLWTRFVGLIKTPLATSKAPLRIDALHPFVRPTVCRQNAYTKNAVFSKTNQFRSLYIDDLYDVLRWLFKAHIIGRHHGNREISISMKNHQILTKFSTQHQIWNLMTVT